MQFPRSFPIQVVSSTPTSSSASIGLLGWLLIVLVAAGVSVAIVAVTMMRMSSSEMERMPPEWVEPLEVEPDGVRICGPDENPVVQMETTHGTIVIELFEDEAPNTVANFIELIESGFYDGIRFHRIIDGFMIQGGCPTTREGLGPDAGTGGPGYRFADEKPNERQFDRALLLAMANAGPDTNGCQFFITVASTPHLDNGHYTLFGHVVEGGDVVVDRIAKVEVGGESNSTPVEDVQILSVVVLQKRDHPYHVTGAIPETDEDEDGDGDEKDEDRDGDGDE